MARIFTEGNLVINEIEPEKLVCMPVDFWNDKTGWQPSGFNVGSFLRNVMWRVLWDKAPHLGKLVKPGSVGALYFEDGKFIYVAGPLQEVMAYGQGKGTVDEPSLETGPKG